jgi:hypothetical protein
LFLSSALFLGGDTFAVVCSVGGRDGETVSFFSPSASSPPDELLSDSSLPSDSVAECFECSETFDFAGDGDREPDGELDWDEDEEDWDEVEEDRRRAFGEGARRQGSTHWSTACPNLAVVLVT